ncbi:MAG: arginine repressor [Myxococcota bacterium]
MSWRSVLSDLIETGTYRTQRELARAVEARIGRRLNQASISRELQELGVRKVDGVYRLGPDLEIAAHIQRWNHTSGGCLLVFQTDLAYASVIAQTVDTAELPGVLGTIAGDDTIFVAVSGPEAHEALLDLLGLDRR